MTKTAKTEKLVDADLIVPLEKTYHDKEGEIIPFEFSYICMKTEHKVVIRHRAVTWFGKATVEATVYEFQHNKQGNEWADIYHTRLTQLHQMAHEDPRKFMTPGIAKMVLARALEKYEKENKEVQRPKEVAAFGHTFHLA
jgi:hypothetical protein